MPSYQFPAASSPSTPRISSRPQKTPTQLSPPRAQSLHSTRRTPPSNSNRYHPAQDGKGTWSSESFSRSCRNIYVAEDGDEDYETSAVSSARKNWMKMDAQANGHVNLHPVGSASDHGAPKTPRKNRGGDISMEPVSPSVRSPGGVVRSRWSAANEKVKAPVSFNGPNHVKLSPPFHTSMDALVRPQQQYHSSEQYSPSPAVTASGGAGKVMKQREFYEDDKSVGASICSNRWRSSKGNGSGDATPHKSPSMRKLLPPYQCPDSNTSMSSMAPQLPKRSLSSKGIHLFSDLNSSTSSSLAPQVPKRSGGSKKSTLPMLASKMRVAGIRSRKSHQEHSATTIVRGSKVFKIETLAKETNTSPSPKIVDDSRSWIRHFKGEPEEEELLEQEEEDDEEEVEVHYDQHGRRWVLSPRPDMILERDEVRGICGRNDGSEETESTNSESVYHLKIPKTVPVREPYYRQQEIKVCQLQDTTEGTHAVYEDNITSGCRTFQDPYSGLPCLDDVDDLDAYIALNGKVQAAEKSDPNELRYQNLLDDDEQFHRREIFEPYEPEFEDMDVELQSVKGSPNEMLLVDKVPRKKKWMGKNVENFPVWPPIITVRKFEMRNTSGVSIGSGFSEDALTASEGDFDSFGSDDVSSFEDLKFLPPAQRTSYRIRYDGPTNLMDRLPPVPSHDDRFEPTDNCQSDDMPNYPARRRDDMSIDTDTVTLKSCPDVWITPSMGDEPQNAVWKVRRVWAVEEEDEKEEEHSVHNRELFDKIKSLVGAPESQPTSGSGSLKLSSNKDLPNRSFPNKSWHVQTVVERHGKLDSLAPEQNFAEAELQENIHVMAAEAVKEIQFNERAVEEAKKRIRMLKGGGIPNNRMPSRRIPTRDQNRNTDATKAVSEQVKGLSDVEGKGRNDSNSEDINDRLISSDVGAGAENQLLLSDGATKEVTSDQRHGLCEEFASRELRQEETAMEMSDERKETAPTVVTSHDDREPRTSEATFSTTPENAAESNNGLSTSAVEGAMHSLQVISREKENTIVTSPPDKEDDKCGFPVQDEDQQLYTGWLAGEEDAKTESKKSSKTKSNEKNHQRSASKSPGRPRSSKLLSHDDTQEGRRSVSKSPGRPRKKVLSTSDVLLSPSTVSKPPAQGRPVRPGSRRKDSTTDDTQDRPRTVSKSPGRLGSRRKERTIDDDTADDSKSRTRSGSQRKERTIDDDTADDSKSRTRSGSRRKERTIDDDTADDSKPRTRSRSRRKERCIDEDTSETPPATSKSLTKSGSRRKLLSKADDIQGMNRSNRKLPKKKDLEPPMSSRALNSDPVERSLDNEGSAANGTKKQKKKSKEKEMAQSDKDRNTIKTAKMDPPTEIVTFDKGADQPSIFEDTVEKDTSMLSLPAEKDASVSSLSAEKETSVSSFPTEKEDTSIPTSPTRLDPPKNEILTPRRQRIHAASMVHNSDSEDEDSTNSGEDDPPRPSSKSSLTSTLLRDSVGTPWWQKNGDTKRVVDVDSTPRDMKNLSRHRRGGRRLREDEGPGLPNL